MKNSKTKVKIKINNNSIFKYVILVNGVYTASYMSLVLAKEDKKERELNNG